MSAPVPNFAPGSARRIALELVAELPAPVSVADLSAMLEKKGVFDKTRPDAYRARTQQIALALVEFGLFRRSGRRNQYHYEIDLAAYNAYVDGVRRRSVPAAKAQRLGIAPQSWCSALMPQGEQP